MVALTAAWFVGIAVWSALAIGAEANWLPIFDVRATGYSPEAARDFLSVLSEQGRARYLGPMRALDTVFPALLAVTLVLGVWRFFGRSVAIAFSVVAVLAAILDYRENAAIADMLRLEPEAVTNEIVRTASALTMSKWACYLVALTGFAVGLIRSLRTKHA